MGYLILVAVVITYIFMHYIEPRLNVYHELFVKRKSLDARLIDIEIVRLNHEIGAEECILVRKYPELKQSGEPCNRIGFEYNDYPSEEELCEEDVEWDEEDEDYEDKLKSMKKKLKINSKNSKINSKLRKGNRLINKKKW